MRVLSMRALRDFWVKHADAESNLRAWYKIVEKASWTGFVDVRSTFGSASIVDQLTVFNICGNKYRLIAAINFDSHYVFVRAILTHSEYDKGACRHDKFNS